jgi:hypothetical protein
MPAAGAVRLLRRRRVELLALGGYGLVAFLLLGVPLLAHRGDDYLGHGPDAEIFIWSFAWWPHALLHAQNPFVTHAVFTPEGANLTWVTTVPGLALVFAPLTFLVGPVAAYNVAAVLMPALAAWTAFLLCRYLTGAAVPSLVGGYLFGFSSYEIEHAGRGHLNLTSIFLVPLAALVVLRYLDGRIGDRGVVVRLAPLVAFQLLISTEVALTFTLALALALLLCLAFVPGRRGRVVRLFPRVGVAYGLAALLTAPFLVYLVAGFRKGGYNPPGRFIADGVNFVVPSDFALLGHGLASSISSSFAAVTRGQEAFLGLPALVIVGLFVWERARAPAGRYVLACLVVSITIALGGALTVYGHRIVPLPWRLVQGLPPFNNVQTVRFAVYVSLLVAVVLAVWIASRRGGILVWVLPALAVLALLPDPVVGAWATGYQVPPFFTKQVYRSCLDRGETVLPFPIGQGSAMLWQAVNGFHFDIAGGYLGPYIPPAFTSTPGDYYIMGGNHLGPNHAAALRAFIARKHISSAVVAQYEAAFFDPALDELAPQQVVGGVVLYHFVAAPPSCFAS